MTDAEMIAEGESYGVWISPIKSGPVNTAPWPARVAVIGGTKYDESELVRWMGSLRRKYPWTTVVTGSGLGAEKAVQALAVSHGFTVEVPEQDWWPQRKLQVEAVMCGADVVVVVGAETGERATAAIKKHELIGGRPLVMVG